MTRARHATPWSRWYAGIAASVVLACLISASVPAQAQTSPTFVEPSAAQIEMNRRGYQAAKDKDFDRAAKLFNASLELGEINVTYLNLGRTLQKAGQCQKANQAFIKALDAPQVRSPSPVELKAKVNQYRAELARDCPGIIVVKCQPTEAELFINTRPQTCDGRPIEVPPGEVVIKATFGKEVIEKVVKVSAIEPIEPVELVFEGRGSGENAVTLEKSPEPFDGQQAWLDPWAQAGIGVAALSTALILDNFLSTSRNGEFDALADTSPLLFYGVGAGFLISAGFAFDLW